MWTVALLTAVAGCKVGYFHAQTEILPDGSIDRAILQPSGLTPDEGKQADAWDQVTSAPEKSFEDLQGDIRDLPIQDDDEDGYFAGWVKVGPGEQLPHHFEKTAADEKSTSRMKQKLVTRDMGIFTEFAWEETLTDVVTLKGFREARQEFVDVISDLADETFERSLGNEYDASNLVDWFRTDGFDLIEDVTDAAYESALAESRSLTSPDSEGRLKQKIMQICEVHGLKGLLDEEDSLQEEVVLQFARNVVQKTVKRTDGEPLSDEFVLSFLGALGLNDTKKKSDLAKRIRKQWNRVVAERPGGKEQFEKDMEEIGTRLQGVNGGIILGTPENFRYTMSVPGVVTETNGSLLAGNRVEWRFNSSQAWPSGFTMTCRSILPTADGIEELKNWRESVSPATLVQIRTVIRDDPDMAFTLRKCRETGSLSPLQELARNSDDDETIAVGTRVLSLLGQESE